MNELERWIKDSKVDPIQSMNRLQDNGIISDNCIYAEDVADVDCESAIKFLSLKDDVSTKGFNDERTHYRH